jgi:hypothetical protein
MGCDIHTYWEVKTSPDKPWQSLFPMVRNEYYDAEEAAKYGETYQGPEYSVPSPAYDGPFYIGRNYGLFAVLAGVRNYGNTIPISQPRGLPKDISPELFQVSEGYGSDGHSHSFFTVKELEAADWEKPIYDFSQRFIEVINNVKKKAEEEFGVTDPTNIRFVFFFDN